MLPVILAVVLVLGLVGAVCLAKVVVAGLLFGWVMREAFGRRA